MHLRPLTALTLALALAALLALAIPVAGATAGSPEATGAKKSKRRASGAKARVFKRCGKPRRGRRSSRGDIDGDRIKNKRDRDVDGDRKKNGRDCDVDGDGVLNKRDRDVDADRTSNKRDKDIDGDRKRNCRPGKAKDVMTDRDMDGDGVKNTRDRDMDGDRLKNSVDPDTDGDGIGKRKDRDIDCDGIPNYKDSDSDSSGSKEDGSLPAGVRLPRSFFGVVADNVWASVGAERSRNLSDIAATRVGTIRHKFQWLEIEKLPNVYDFSSYDEYVRDVTGRGFEIIPVLFDPPAWRSSRPGGGGSRGTYPPRSNAEFGQFAARLVQRYGPNGSFWRSNPSLPKRPLRSWQVWNEPHLKSYWPSGQDPSEYVDMLRAVGGAIKRADPGAEVIAAGLSETNIGIPVDKYLKGMYDAGGRGTFDTVAVHPYASAADQSYDIMNRVRRVMDRSGDGGTEMRVTELGWATWGSTPNPFNVGPEGQAELVKRVWATLVKRREELKLKGLIYYNWRDIPPHAPDFQDYFGLHVGLLDLAGNRKPAYNEFARVVRTLTAG